MRIYLDACAINRLTDDQLQARILTEAEAVEQVLDLVSTGRGRWIASSALRDELERNPNETKRAVSLALLDFASEFVEPGEATFQRASASPRMALVPSMRYISRSPKRHRWSIC